MFTERLDDAAQESLRACSKLRQVRDNGERMEYLLQYKRAMKILHSSCVDQETSTKKCLSEFAEQKTKLWSANQEHNAIMSQIERLKKTSFAFLSIADVDIIDRLRRGAIDYNDDAQIIPLLEQEVLARSELSAQLEGKKESLAAQRRKMDAQMEQRRKLQSQLSILFSSQPALILSEELSKYSKNVPLALKDMFESLSNYSPPPWEQLRFFQKTADGADERLSENEDSRSSMVSEDYIRIKLNDQVSLTCYIPSMTGSFAIKMDAIEYKFSEEEADAWVKGCVTSSLLDSVLKIRSVWTAEADLVSECQEGSLFSNLHAVKPHTFDFKISSLHTASYTSAPSPFWKIEAGANTDEAFVARCRLVQDRLNTADMITSPIPLQFAFLRKLIQ